MAPLRVAAVVLAAGKSRRMGRNRIAQGHFGRAVGAHHQDPAALEPPAEVKE